MVINAFLVRQNWENQTSMTDIDEMWTKFTSILASAVDKFVPLRVKANVFHL